MKYQIISLVLGLAVSPALKGADEAVPLAFRPPDSCRFTVTSQTIRQSDAKSTRGGGDTTLTVADGRLSRGDSGWVLESTMRSMVFHPIRDSLQNNLARLLIGTRTLLYINAEGKAVRLSGYESISSRLDSIVPPGMRGLMARVLSPENLAAQQMTDWNVRLGNVLGRPLQLGRMEHSSAPSGTVPGLPWSLLTVSRLEDTLRIDGRLCLRTSTHVDSDPHRLARSLGMTAADLAAMFGLTDSAMAVQSGPQGYQSRLTLVFEVATLLEREEEMDREIVLAVPGIDGKETIRRSRETVEKAISYH